MGIRNQIVSYFVDSSEPPRVFLSPVTMNDEVALEIIKKEYKKPLSGKRMLHVCFDKDSKMIYLPNAHAFTKEQKEPLLLAAKLHISKQLGDYKFMPPIEGSPFSSIRIRSVDSFGYVNDAIKQHFKSDVENLTVVEANLERMPSTVKQLPAIYHNNKNFSGGLINKNISFCDEIDIKGKRRKNPISLTTVKAPFILIDMSPTVDPSATEKEWAVLSGYRDNMASQGKCSSEVIEFAPLYAAKRYLYMGWPFEEVCNVLLEFAKDFGSLIKAIDQLLIASNKLHEEGYTDPSAIPYYISFKIDPKTFPYNFKEKVQIPFFEIVSYDKKTQQIVIKTPAYLDSRICFKILEAQSRPFIVRYNPTINKIDVKVQNGIYKELKVKTKIPSTIKKMICKDMGKDDLEYRSDQRSMSVSLSSNQTCHLRKISDYYYAQDQIKKMCKERDMKFEDIDVMVGPIERIFGRGIQGGFMDEKAFENTKLKPPYQIEKGLRVMPPLMAVNSETMPSYASQTETLVHEYSHKLYSITNPEHEHLYNKNPKLRDQDPQKYWDLYLGDADEKLAHKEEIKFELKSGKSVDEIVRDKVGGAITKQSYKKTYMIALKFKEMVDEVAQEMEKEYE